ncbi:type VI secretion system Vgr family protein [Aerolutibacter ruishenii]|uniref:Rhs element Vgr protein n=1 Tax=Aerolutibacter ruishenii TaxID=686800 RepID=A0A562LYF0_9GAMM|nr:type VI secretion system Vgr family protein [Lysobacter ruishenii]TWI12640.1 Rhs element Vgr protein [Lysobacter ruishenii]
MDWIDSAHDAVAALGKLLSQDARLIELDCALPGVFVPERFEGREAVCEGFRFEVDCLSPSAFVPLPPLLGQPAALRLRRADGGQRVWHGLCTHAAELGSDGGLARYRLTLEPWTALLRLRTNALIFQDKDVLGVLTQVFAQYPQAAWRSEVTQPMQQRAITTQYRESDWEFVTRLLAENGLAWRFDHDEGLDGTATGRSHSATPAGHTLVVFDRDAEAPTAQPGTARFHRINATETLDAISHFGEQRSLAPDAVAMASWDAAQVEAVSATGEVRDSAVGTASREVYVADRAGRFAGRAEAEQASTLQLDGLRLPQSMQFGAGSERGLAHGKAFTLLQHPEHSGQQFVPLAVEHSGANNLGSGIVALLGVSALERGSYRNRFIAVAKGIPIVPVAKARPLASGAQTARVVGLPDAVVTSSRDHQVRIQFPWQRGAQPHRGGLTDTGDNGDGHAPGDHTGGTWVRVAEWLAGPNWGSHALPRIGSEVLVEFLHADIDQPVVTGQLFNGDVAPPYAAGIDSSANHIGTLSGLHTQSLDASGTQQWLMDDAPGQLRQRLHTTLADSRVELGYLVQHGNAHRGGLRGQGFDVATLGWGNLRGGQGVLLSTTARGNAASTQLDTAEAVSQLRGAEQTAQALSEALGQHNVPVLQANEPQSALIEVVDAPNADSASGEQADTSPNPFSTAALLTEGPDSLAFATPKSALAYAGSHLHLTAQDDTHLAAGHTFAGVSGGHVALFAQKGPIRTIAANDPVSVQAHAGTLELLADQSVTVTATDERIDVLAKEKIVLQAGQTAITLEGGDITFACPGDFTVKASENPFLGGDSVAADLIGLPRSRNKMQSHLTLKRNYCDGEPTENAEYLVAFSDGSKRQGKLNKKGIAELDDVPSGPVNVQFGEDARAYKPHRSEDTEQLDNPLKGRRIDAETAIALFAAAQAIEELNK